MKPKISIIITLYNKEKSIQKTLQSVINQTEQCFELIVINDGSTDNSVSVTRKHLINGRIVNQENAGVSAARNRGIKEANTNLVAFLDADDEWHPQFLESIFRLIAQFPEADVFGSSYKIFKEGDTLRLPRSYALFDPDWKGIIPNYLEIINTAYPFNSSSVAVRKQVIDKIGGFPIGVKYGEDIDTWIRLSFKSKMAYINTPLSIYHKKVYINRAAVSDRKSYDEFYPSTKLYQYLQTGIIPESQKQSAIEYIAKSNLPLAQANLYSGDIEKAIELLSSCKGTKKHKLYMDILIFWSHVPPKVLRPLLKFKHNIVNPLFHQYAETENRPDHPTE